MGRIQLLYHQQYQCPTITWCSVPYPTTVDSRACVLDLFDFDGDDQVEDTTTTMKESALHHHRPYSFPPRLPSRSLEVNQPAEVRKKPISPMTTTAKESNSLEDHRRYPELTDAPPILASAKRVKRREKEYRASSVWRMKRRRKRRMRKMMRKTKMLFAPRMRCRSLEIAKFFFDF